MEPSRTVTRRVEARLVWAYVRADQARLVDVVFPGSPSKMVERDGVLHPAASFPGEPAHPYALVGISGYAALRPRARPPAFCPVCRERVWLKLGSRVRHHYAHAAESACTASGAEGALHYAAKIQLAAELGGLGSVGIERRCDGAPTDPRREPCRATDYAEWISGWDEVRVEHSLPSLRADLLLLRDGEPLGAIEVFATHAVDEERARKYRVLGIPWLEVPADEIVSPRASWATRRTLTVIGDSRLHPDRWRCPHHRRLYDAWVDQQRTGVHRLAGRFVHLYRTDGGLTAGERRIERVPICMIERRENGEIVEAWLEREDSCTRIGAAVTTDDRHVARERLHHEFLRWVRWTRTERGATVDSPMRWLPPDQIPGRDLDRIFPQRLRWDLHLGDWLAAPNLPSLAWPAIAARADAHAPDAILGHRPCYWSALPAGDRGPLSHALVRECWVTLREQTWEWEGERATRADLEVYFHGGAHWEQLPGGPHVVTVTLAPGEEARWSELMPEIAAAIADSLAELRGGRTSVERLARGLVERHAALAPRRPHPARLDAPPSPKSGAGV